MNKKHSKRSSQKIAKEQNIKVKNIKHQINELTDVSLTGSTELQLKSSEKAKRRYVRTRAVQANPEDIDKSDCIPRVEGENETIVPVVGETVAPQCRFCLRRVLRGNLKIILTKHKPKVLAAFKIKIFPGDAYPLACCNCLNLLEIMLDFKEAVLKAKNLLLSERMYLDSNGWDDPDCVEAIAKCKTVVEQHKKEIDCTYQEVMKRKTATEVMAEDESYGDPPSEPFLVESENHFECPESLTEEIVQTVEPIPNDKEVKQSSSPFQIDIKDEGDDSNLLPSMEMNDLDFTVSLQKPKRIKKEKKAKKTGSSRKSLKKDSSVKEQLSRSELCDLCGQRVCFQAVESHKNRHLGIKPYTCPAEGCGLSFYSRFNQVKHVKRIHGENGVPTHKCDICGTHIRGALNVLNWHKRKHDEVKQHVCQFCGKAFTIRQYLRQHVTVVHTEVFPHECRYCGKKFKLKWSMWAHEKNVHEKKQQPVSMPAEPQAASCEAQPKTECIYN
ncbi:zinc finger and SCAN domain-containing protein 12-like [Sabethes cyaneus]|uniref:zinc finger and SCAN domain-containing protein 12-like n=1 Tax=Sabethes cyaneus TaxID=53552 RepID=UPI00237E250E|nr:zinc finger and SCAN domain-containing protein 12-like [Sabethes cyaneus]